MNLSLRILLFLCLNVTMMQAQYDPYKIFVPDFYNHKGNEFRSASGKPSAKYWQNSADYAVNASFDVKSLLLKANVVIDYTNNSPDQLNTLWLYLDQNTNDPQSTTQMMRNPTNQPDPSKTMNIAKVVLIRNGKSKVVPFVVNGTRMQIRLDNPVQPGEKLQLNIDYSYVLQQQGGGGRSGYMDSKNGRIYEFSYWYPRMAVYDDYYGWNTLPFIGGGEMYMDYGTIDYNVTVPSDQVVVGAGELLNGNDILNAETLKRLNKAEDSDKTVMIRSAKDLKKSVTKNKGLTTWHFRMENTRDVAWAMSTAYIWDAAKINIPNGKKALAQSVYPVESTQENRAWPRSTEMLKFSVEFFSKFLKFNYPYPTATSVGGSVGGMEFPGFVFNGYKADAYEMFLLAAHEIGHTWFPMIVGSDERRDQFMDEGFNVFMDIYAHDAFNNGEFAPKRDGEYAPGKGNPADEIIPIIEETKNGPTLMTPADQMSYKYTHPLDYFKTAFGLVMLREVVLGQDRFDYAFQQYVHDWAYKHPRPEDFFRSMDNNTGEDLTWFWNGWFLHNWQLDQEVTGVDYVKEDPKNGAIIHVKNNDQMVMPILVDITEENGKVHHLKVPVQIWSSAGEVQFKVNTTSKIEKVELDSKHQLPDTNRANNIWPR